MEVAIDVLSTASFDALVLAFKQSIAEALGVSVDDVVKFTVFEISGDKSRRLQSSQLKQYEVAYEILSSSSIDLEVVVERARAIFVDDSVESNVFRKALTAQADISQVNEVLPKLPVRIFEDEVNIDLSSQIELGNEDSDENDSRVVEAILLSVAGLACIAIIILSGVWRRRCKAAKADAPSTQQNNDVGASAKGELDVEEVVVRIPTSTLLGNVSDGNKAASLASPKQVHDMPSEKEEMHAERLSL
jgi:hypothetical protein